MVLWVIICLLIPFLGTWLHDIKVIATLQNMKPNKIINNFLFIYFSNLYKTSCHCIIYSKLLYYTKHASTNIVI